ncbi:MAG: hypothetical protein NW202_13400 [Nitrospira sp.]|nr:hypothetical protein [Nitrospira sp.]
MSLLDEIEDHPPEGWESEAERDPPEHLRVWFRSTKDGQLGYMVKRDGRDHIRLDRPGEEIVKPFKADLWQPEHQVRKMAHAQTVQIAFEADRQLCKALGDFQRASKEWQSLKDEERIAWMRHGPKGPRVRVELYRAIIDTLRPLANETD